ncbi:MAG: molybdenum cofactor guanylyltransferase [Actinomycetota bacterium]|nr:molybdenum cofactor guanylyltransferase [Actinomycetota bacterium]
MGQDKAWLELDGEPLVRRVASRLSRVCGRVLIASGDGQRLGTLPWDQVADAVPGRGPLAGIVAGLEAADTPLVAVAAVDQPFASPEVLVALATLWRGEAAVVPLVDGRVQPFSGVYATHASASLGRVLASGTRSVTHALSAVGARIAGSDVWAGADPDGAFAVDLDRPADLAALRPT